MGYKIAVATSDGVHVDLHFGRTEFFTIYQVNEDGSYVQLEKRRAGGVSPEGEVSPAERKSPRDEESSARGVSAGEINTACENERRGCAGCGKSRRKDERIESIRDCRCVLCARCGAGTERELGKRNITAFTVEKRIDEALEKIIRYYANNQKRRGMAGGLRLI